MGLHHTLGLLSKMHSILRILVLLVAHMARIQPFIYYCTLQKVYIFVCVLIKLGCGGSVIKTVVLINLKVSSPSVKIQAPANLAFVKHVNSNKFIGTTMNK